MSYLDDIRKSKDKAQVAFQEFALSTRKFAEHLFCFFEGKDDVYYVPRIKQITDKYKIISCGGRDRVLKVHQLITNRPEYNDYKVAFFIDKDFNPPLAEQEVPIYETPCYSIENLYTSINVFREILLHEFRLSEIFDEGVIQTSLDLFRERQKEFHQSVTLFNSWYACLIDLRNQENKQTGVNLGNKFPKEFIDFTLDSVSASYDLEKIKHTFPKALAVEEDILNEKKELFKSFDATQTFRGKYELEFLIRFIQLLIQDSHHAQKYIKQKLNFDFSDTLNHQQAMKIFSTYAETPERLLQYLKNVINKTNNLTKNA